MTRKMKHVWMVEDQAATPGHPARSFWTRIGVALEGDDGALELTLTAVPVNGRMIVSEAAPLALGVGKTRGAA